MAAKAQKLINGINIIMATPGCLLDHMQNTPGFMYKDLQCLIIDKTVSWKLGLKKLKH